MLFTVGFVLKTEGYTLIISPHSDSNTSTERTKVRGGFVCFCVSLPTLIHAFVPPHLKWREVTLL